MPVIDTQVGIFTTRMRSEFFANYQAVQEPAPFERFTLRIPSTARIETYPFSSPVPGVEKFEGHRRYARMSVTPYSVENLEYDTSMIASLRDIEDDQVGIYGIKAAEMAMKVRQFPGRAVLAKLAAAEADLCFDGTAMAADSHTIGTGDNLLAENYASNDAATYNLVALYHGDPLKPLIWQDRKGPIFRSNMGESDSSENKEVKMWCDLEGAAAFGYWWHLVWVNMTDTPTVAELHATFGKIEAAFRSFRLPVALSGDAQEYIHEQRTFNQNNLTLVGSTGLATLLRQALNQEIVATAAGTAAVTNPFMGFANYMVSAYLN